MSPEQYEAVLVSHLQVFWTNRSPRSRLDRETVRSMLQVLRMFRRLRFTAAQADAWQEEANRLARGQR